MCHRRWLFSSGYILLVDILYVHIPIYARICCLLLVRLDWKSLDLDIIPLLPCHAYTLCLFFSNIVVSELVIIIIGNIFIWMIEAKMIKMVCLNNYHIWKGKMKDFLFFKKIYLHVFASNKPEYMYDKDW